MDKTNSSHPVSLKLFLLNFLLAKYSQGSASQSFASYKASLLGCAKGSRISLTSIYLPLSVNFPITAAAMPSSCNLSANFSPFSAAIIIVPLEIKPR